MLLEVLETLQTMAAEVAEAPGEAFEIAQEVGSLSERMILLADLFFQLGCLTRVFQTCLM